MSGYGFLLLHGVGPAGPILLISGAVLNLASSAVGYRDAQNSEDGRFKTGRQIFVEEFILKGVLLYAVGFTMGMTAGNYLQIPHAHAVSTGDFLGANITDGVITSGVFLHGAYRQCCGNELKKEVVDFYCDKLNSYRMKSYPDLLGYSEDVDAPLSNADKCSVIGRAAALAGCHLVEDEHGCNPYENRLAQELESLAKDFSIFFKDQSKQDKELGYQDQQDPEFNKLERRLAYLSRIYDIYKDADKIVLGSAISSSDSSVGGDNPALRKAVGPISEADMRAGDSFDSTGEQWVCL